MKSDFNELNDNIKCDFLDSSKQYYYEVGNCEELNNDETINLFKERETYKDENKINEINNKIAEGNLKLVITIAKSYAKNRQEFQEYISEGNIGLLNAINNFKYEKGKKFSSYAAYWIRKSIINANRKESKGIILSEYNYYLLSKILAYREKFYKENDYYPSNVDISKLFELELFTVEKLLDASEQAISLDDSSDNNSDLIIYKTIDYMNMEIVEYLFKKFALEDLYENHFKKLKPKEIIVLINKYGLNGRIELSDEEIGKRILNITRQRVNQLHNSALKKLCELMSNYSPDDYEKSLELKRNR